MTFFIKRAIFREKKVNDFNKGDKGDKNFGGIRNMELREITIQGKNLSKINKGDKSDKGDIGVTHSTLIDIINDLYSFTWVFNNPQGNLSL